MPFPETTGPGEGGEEADCCDEDGGDDTADDSDGCDGDGVGFEGVGDVCVVEGEDVLGAGDFVEDATCDYEDTGVE